MATGFPKAEYAIGYFTEMGIGCRRDPLEANVWYVRAADHGNANARQRLEIIRAASSGLPPQQSETVQPAGTGTGTGADWRPTARRAGSTNGLGMAKGEAKSMEVGMGGSGDAGAVGANGKDAGGKKKILGIF